MTAAPDLEARATAYQAGLRYTSDQSAGIRRKREGDSFVYLTADGKTVK